MQLLKRQDTKLGKFLTVYIILQPIIDLLTSLQLKYSDFPLTFGVITRTLFMFFCCFYILFQYKHKNKKYLVIYLVLLGIYCLAFLAYNTILHKDILKLFIDLKELFKVIYLPIVFVGFYSYNKNNIKLEYGKLMAIVALLYIFIITIAFLTNTSFNSYEYGYGYKGWFYAANEIGIIVATLSPILLYKVLNVKSLYAILPTILVAFVSGFIGTKAVFLIISFYIFITFIVLLAYSIIKKKIKINSIAVLGMVGILIISFFPFSPLYKNVSYSFTQTIPIDDDKDSNKVEDDKVDTKKENDSYFLKIANWLLSNRISFIYPIRDCFINSNFFHRCVGVGYSNFNKAIEMDYFTLYYQHGYLGSLIIFSPALLAIYMNLKYIFKNIKSLLVIKSWTYFYSFGLLLVAAGLSGHVIIAPAVSIYIVLTSIELKNSKKVLEEKSFENIGDNANIQ